MREVKNFVPGDLFSYHVYGRGMLSTYIPSILKTEAAGSHCFEAFWSSGGTNSSNNIVDASAIFFTEDVLREYLNNAYPGRQTEFRPLSDWWKPPVGEFIKVPFIIQGDLSRIFEGWIYLGKLNSLDTDSLRKLPYLNPQYFSDKRLGFFTEAHIVDGKIKEVKPGDKFKVHGNWPGNKRTRDVDFEITIDNVHMQPGGIQFVWGSTYYTRTTLGTGETISGTMSDDTMLKFLNTPGWVYEYNGKPWPINKRLGFFGENYVYGKDKFELHAGDRFITSTEEVRDPLYRRGCSLASNTLFRIDRIDDIYTTREIPCTGGFDPNDEPEEYDVKYEVIRKEDNIEFIVLKGKLIDLMDYFEDTFYTEDDEDGYDWDDYSPVLPPVKYPRVIYYNFDPEQPYDPNNVPKIIHQAVSCWCGPDDDEVPLEEYESDINIPGAIVYFNNQKVEPPKQRLGFFNEDINMKLDLLQEKIDKNFTPEEIWDVMTDTSLSGEQKSQKLFGRPEDYISHVQYFCFEGRIDNTSYLLNHNYISEKGREIRSLSNLNWELEEAGDKACHAGDIRGSGDVAIDVATVFHTDHPDYTLQGSWNYYVARQMDALSQGYNWWNYIQYTVSKIEETGLLQYTPPKKLGFFKESKKLTEEISNDWCQQNLKIDYDTLFEFADINFNYNWQDDSLDSFSIRWVHPEDEHDWTEIVSPWYDDSGIGTFDSLQEMCDFYGEDFVKNWLTKFVEWLEKNHLWEKPKPKLGFFTEGIDTNFDAAEIIQIMTDESLSSSEKCKRLFGRKEDYLMHVQWLCFRKSDKWLDYLYEHNYFTDNAKEQYENDYPQFRIDFSEVIDRAENDRNESGKRTLFYDWRESEEVPCDLNTSYDAYVVEGECNGSFLERKVMNWYNHIKFSVSYMEDRGYVIDHSNDRRLGFFNK